MKSFTRFSVVLFAAAILWPAILQAQGASERLVSRVTAERHGLKRAWSTQIALNRATGHIAYITQESGTLFVQTSDAMVHAIDAENGRTLWAVQVGRRGLLNLACGANSKYVAVLNGSQLYVIDRKNGQLVWDRQLTAVPGAGAALSDTRVFVPMVNGMIEGYLIDDPKASPWFYQAFGRILVQPLVSPLTLSWTTDNGRFYVADVREAKIRFRLETGASIESRPAYWPPYVFATSLDGFAYAIHEESGETEWKFAASDPISEPPMAIGNSVYVTSDHAGMYQLDAASGNPRWFAPHITQFLALSPTRVYAVDNLENMAILDVRTGQRIDGFSIASVSLRHRNRLTDRIYLATGTGQIECLHEIELKKPIIYQPPLPEKLQERKITGDKAPGKAAPPAKAAPAENAAKDAQPAVEPKNEAAPEDPF